MFEKKKTIEWLKHKPVADREQVFAHSIQSKHKLLCFASKHIF